MIPIQVRYECPSTEVGEKYPECSLCLQRGRCVKVTTIVGVRQVVVHLCDECRAAMARAANELPGKSLKHVGDVHVVRELGVESVTEEWARRTTEVLG